jgi:hypothetical protein
VWSNIIYNAGHPYKSKKIDKWYKKKFLEEKKMNKNKLLGVFVTETEYVEVKKQALKLDMNISSFLRLKLGLEPPKKRGRKEKEDEIIKDTNLLGGSENE